MIKILALLLFVAACGKDTQSISLSARHGSSCSVSEAKDLSGELVIGARIVCTDGSSTVLLNGADGNNGEQGIRGERGNSCSVTREANATLVTITCGENSVVINDGADGANGIDAEGCSLTKHGNNASQFRLTCGDESVVFSTNPGQSGNPGQGNN